MIPPHFYFAFIKLRVRRKSMDVLWTALFLGSLLVLFVILIEKQHQKEGNREAPGPWNLPILGSLHRVLGGKPPHQSFRDLSAVYGPIMRLKICEINAIVISSAEAAREIMKTHDIAFATRPISVSVDAIFYGGNNIIFGPYGEFWHQLRRLCNLELLSTKRVRSYGAIREKEVSHLIKFIAASSGDVVNLSTKLAETINNIMARVVIGSRCDDQKLFLSALDDAVEFVSGFTIMDLFPSMPIIGRITGFRHRLEQLQKKLDLMAENIVQEHKEKRANHVYENDDGRLKTEDLTDVLLRIQQEDNLQFPLSNDNIKAVVNDMLLAGSETSSTILEWVMSELVRNPAIMKKAQKEVTEVIGGSERVGKLVDEKLISGRLTYLQLVIKETLRLHPPAPLLLPRENQERRKVMSYEIPAKTMIMVNVWAIGRSDKYWDDPESFQPERFEGNQVDFKGAHFEFLPFGAGRRICPGMQFGLASMEIVLAHLLYYFDWEYSGKKGEKLDMLEAFGVTTRRKSALSLIPTLRFPLP